LGLLVNPNLTSMLVVKSTLQLGPKLRQCLVLVYLSLKFN